MQSTSQKSNYLHSIHSPTQNELLVITSHELKIPISIITGYISMISMGKYGKIPSKIQQVLRDINSATLELTQTIDNLLETARLEAQKIEPAKTPLSLCQLSEDTIQLLAPLAKQKKIHITHSCTSNHSFVIANPNHAKQIMINLISNAIKYSETGTITIKHFHKDNFLITNVCDQGPGIHKKDQNQIFGLFFRLKKDLNTPGIGLGLAITQHQVQKMGGKIWLKSKIGQGTTFSFSLPLTHQNN